MFGEGVRTRLLPLALVMVVALIGCRRGPNGMLGQTLSDVEKKFGAPDEEAEAQVTADRRAPQPRLLSVGDRYLSVSYSNLKGRQWHLVFVTPETYKRVKGKSPGASKWYLLEVSDYDKDLVF